MKIRNPFVTDKKLHEERSQVLKESGLYIKDGVIHINNPSNTVANIRVTDETALEIPAVISALKEISETFAALTYKVMRGDDDMEHGLAYAINTRPNDKMSGYQFKKTMMANIALRGDAYAEIVDKADSRETYNIYPRMNKDVKRVNKDNRSEDVDYYEYKGRRIEPSNMIHVMGMSFDGLTGESPIQLARTTIALYIASTRYGSNFFAKGGRPSGILSINTEDGDGVNNIQRKQMKDEWEANQDGGLAVIGDASFVPVTTAPGDAQFIETKNFLIQEIARIFNIPLSKIADTSSRTYNNVEQEAVEFIVETLLPLVRSFESEIDRKFFEPVGGNLSGSFDYQDY